VRDAFDAIRRELEDYVRRRRGDVKTHHGPAHGTVIRLFRETRWPTTGSRRSAPARRCAS
jgi:hypothetical protein